MKTSHPAISPEQKKDYAEMGYFMLENFFDTGEVGAVQENLIRLLMESRGEKHPRGIPIDFEKSFKPAGKDVEAMELGIRKYFQFAERDPWFWHLYTAPRFTRTIQAVTGENGKFLQSMALVKPPEIGIPKSWHQDSPYFPIQPASGGVGFWVALDDATLENGCMQVVPGSHLRGLVPHVQGETGWKLPDETMAPLAHEIVPLPVKAGTALVFSPLLFHFTDANRTAKGRRAIQFHYTLESTVSQNPGFVLHPLTPDKMPHA